MSNKHSASLAIKKMQIMRYSTSLAIRKMQIKTTMRYHFTPTRIAIQNTHTEQIQVVEDSEKLEASYIAGGMQNGAAAIENSLVFPQKVKQRVIIRPIPSNPRYCEIKFIFNGKTGKT